MIAGVLPVAGGLFVAVQTLLLAYSSHRYLTLWRRFRPRGAGPRPRRRERCALAVRPRRGVARMAEPRLGAAQRSRMRSGACREGAPLAPAVTVQLPLYNERRVARRLIDAVAALDYPAGRLEIQVLDDSTDETRTEAEAAAARHRARGADIRVLHRERRDGCKAGALAAGLAQARGQIIVVFDADFVPAPDFLARVLPHFDDPSVGMVQARWGHLNRDRSLLTRAQAAMLDAHFLLEHEARMTAGLFLNFNGTAGAWRRACIESAGGWSDDTVTEDLDLSYRAQLAGWRFVSAAEVVAPAELPADIEALKSQQTRWARGSIQTARKLLPAVLRARLKPAVKLEACFHLTSNVAYPLMLLSGALLLPALLARAAAPPRLAIALDAVALLAGVVPVCAFLAAGQRARGASAWAAARDVAAVLVLGAGLAVTNAAAVLEGLAPGRGDWQRTPKTGDGGAAAAHGLYAPRRSWSGGLEVVCALYFAALALLAWRAGHPGWAPFLLVITTGLGYVGARTLAGRNGMARRVPAGR